MKKNVVKIVNILFIAMIIIFASTNCFYSFATTPSDITGNDNPTGSTELTDLGNDVVGVLRIVGIVLSVVIIIILGIKYMMGSAEEKSEYKKSMMPYIVGAALIFAGSIFANVIYEFFNGMNS